MGVVYYPIRIARAGLNPIADIVTLCDLIRLMRRVKPDVVLNYTIKPNIYGGLAAWFCGIRNVFSMIEGLGRAFMPMESFAHAVFSVIAKNLYRIGLRNSKRIFFLNPDDLHQFIEEGYVKKERTVLLNGIGIDLAYYAKEELVEHPTLQFLMIARLLKDKGVREYIDAARIVRAHGRPVEFVLVGDLDENPSSIKQEELDSWQQEGLVNYVKPIDDVRLLYRDCHIYVLPSYREGTPRTTLEAIATGRAVITSDAPGCRETVRQASSDSVWSNEKGAGKLKFGHNGILVPVKDVEALATAMEFFIDHPEQIGIMGRESRVYAQERYDVHKVNAVMLQEMGLLNG
jgi:glycosyltransferase involved in cell wall biosynthesis